MPKMMPSASSVMSGHTIAAMPVATQMTPSTANIHQLRAICGTSVNMPRTLGRARMTPPHPDRAMPPHTAAAQSSPMANLIAIAYPDESTAREVLNTLARLQTEKSIELEDAVIVTRNQDGKVKLHQSSKTAAMGATGGALWGGLIGLIFLAPLLGMAVGAAAGGAAGAVTDVGVDDKFMKDLGTNLKDGGAAIVVLVRQSTPDKVLPRISEYGGQVIQSSLDDETEARLQAALESQEAAV